MITISSASLRSVNLIVPMHLTNVGQLASYNVTFQVLQDDVKKKTVFT